MIGRTIVTQLEGSVALDWRTEGRVATLVFGKPALAVGGDEG